MKRKPIDSGNTPLQQPQQLSSAMSEPQALQFSSKPETSAEQLLTLVLMTIHTLARDASQGDQKALAALYKVAAWSTSSLNGLALETLKPLAGELEVWPFNLSWVKSWNSGQIKERLQVLELGTKVKAVVDLEAVLKKGARTNQIGALLVDFVESCRRYGAITTGVRELKLPQEQDVAVNAFRRVHTRIARIANFLNIPWPAGYDQDAVKAAEQMVYRYCEKSVKLPRVNAMPDGAGLWFALGMDLVEELTDRQYYLEKYGLLEMNRKKNSSMKPGDVKAGIRQGIKEGFDAAVGYAEPSAFTKV